MQPRFRYARAHKFIDGSINPLLPGKLDSSRPKLSGYRGFPAAEVSPFLETPWLDFSGKAPKDVVNLLKQL